MKFKYLLSIVLVFALCLGVLNLAFADEITEVPEGYTPIYTAEDLYNIRNDLDGKYIMMNDIDLSVYENWEPIGTSETPFTGELDGDGKSVFNMTIKGKYTETDNLYFAMFTAIKNSTITDLNIINIDIDAEYTGTSVEAFRAGALAGYANTSTVKNCISSGNIRLNGFYEGCTGGIFGKENASSPTLCVNYTDIKIITENTYEIYVGGITGVASNDNICNCANYGNFAIECTDSDNEARILKIGGIVGDSSNRNTISNCFNRGNIDVNFCMPSIYLGGISGECRAVENSYNIGTISVSENYSSYIGGIAGDFSSGGLAILPAPKLENVYYINDKLYPSYVDSSVPGSNDFENAKILTEEEFKNQASFIGFDFETVWEMEENGYPVLQNQPVLPENIPERPTTTEITTEPTTTKPVTEPTIESTTEPEPTTEPSTQSTTHSETESTTQHTDEPTTEFDNNGFCLENLRVVRAVKWLLNFIWKIVTCVIKLL